MKLKLYPDVTRDELWDSVRYCVESLEEYEQYYLDQLKKDPTDSFANSMQTAYRCAKETMIHRLTGTGVAEEL